MFFVLIPSSLCREPLATGEEKTDVVINSGLEPAREIPKAQAADPPSEPAKAAADVAKDVVAPSEAPPLRVDLGSRAAGDGDDAMADAFEVAPGRERGVKATPSPFLLRLWKRQPRTMPWRW